MDPAGGAFTAIWSAVRGKTPVQDLSEGEEDPDQSGADRPGGSQPGSGAAIGGDPSQGYYQTTPPAGGEPPMSPGGHSYYTEDDYPEGWEPDGMGGVRRV